jgi:predicted kinase
VRVIILVGVPASGKSWVTERVAGLYNHIPHDDYSREDYLHTLLHATKGSKDILAEAPFNAAGLVNDLKARGVVVEEWLVTAPLDEIKARYAARKGREYPANFATNHARYEADAHRFAYKGTSSLVAMVLKATARG